MPESDDVRELRELLARMPEIAARLDAEALKGDIEHLELQDWAARTVAAAEKTGRQDIADRVKAIIANLEAVRGRAATATQARREAQAEAEEVLRQVEE